MSERGERALELTPEMCKSFRGIRSFVMRRAHQIMAQEGVRFSDAMKRAWAEAKMSCLREYGIPV